MRGNELEGCHLNRVVWEGFPEETTSEQRSEGCEKHTCTWEKSAAGKGNSQCKGPGVADRWYDEKAVRRPMCLEQVSEGREVGKRPDHPGLRDHNKDFAFTLREAGVAGELPLH